MRSSDALPTEFGAEPRSDVGLYYPFIHFLDEEWLKMAALYWPRIGRIVPPEYEPHDSDTVKRLADELDFVANVEPGVASYFTGELFAGFLLEHEERLRKRFSVSRADDWAPDPVTIQRMGLRLDDTSLTARLAHIYMSKIDPDLLHGLMESGLAVRARGSGWIGVHPRLADVYMAALAEEIARRNQLEPLTDDPVNHVAASGWSIERLAEALLGNRDLVDARRSQEDLSTALALVAFRSVVPKHSIDVEQVISIRSRYEDERGAFVLHTRALAAELNAMREIEDPVALSAHLGSAYEATIGEELTALKRAINSVGVETAFSAANMKLVVPAPLATGAAIAGANINPLVGLGGAIIVAVAQLGRSYRREVGRRVAESPASYLLRVERALTPKSLMGQIRKRISAFVRGI